MTILIVGSDSAVGKALVDSIKNSEGILVGTTRRKELVNDTDLYLDLSENMEEWECSFPVKTAIICAGITNLDRCDRDPEGTVLINVRGVADLVKNLVSKGTFVIYMSTNQVFDGSMPDRLPVEPFSPVTEYGRQKAETERLISQWKDSTAIVRFTKILGKENTLFFKWINDLKEDKTIHPFKDKYISPVSLSFAVSVLKLVALRKISGLLQVSGDKDISYADIAYRIAKLLKVDPKLVEPIEVLKAGKDKEIGGRYSTLNTNRLKSVLGIEPPDVWESIDNVIKGIII